MSGSSLDGMDIVFAEFLENGGQWSFEIKNTACYEYDAAWTERLQQATTLNALDYQLLHTAYGHYTGQQVNRFIEENNLHYQVGIIASHGHTTFHLPAQKTTAQLGDGAAIAATTGINVVSDLRSLDIAFGGQGAPIVPIGERLLLKDYNMFLNIGGIANISFNTDPYTAFDICPVNRVLNMLAADAGKKYDEDGKIAAGGEVKEDLLQLLNALEYYKKHSPKSLANSFGTDIVYPMVKSSGYSIADELRTMTEHIAQQTANAVAANNTTQTAVAELLVTGGGAFNKFLLERIQFFLGDKVKVVVPDESLVKYKEALIMALIGVLRWREEYNVFASVTGAGRSSIGGALWIGQEG
jgi:anhydro-N-acetylmuramic acid kinase